jgi:chitin disaccharide deacetylase
MVDGFPDAPKRVVLCADDYALTPGINEAILNLLDAGRISGASVMPATEIWRTSSADIKPFLGAADIGLHFTLTELPLMGAAPSVTISGSPVSFPNLALKAYTGQIDTQDIREELTRQWNSFVDETGQLPSHIDGHQHVHQLPSIREAIVQHIIELPEAEWPYIRVCKEYSGSIWRRGLDPMRSQVFSLAANKLCHLAGENGIRVNNGFSGIYNFDPARDYATLFEQFLSEVESGALVLCHPGALEARMQVDPISLARRNEYKFLSSSEFLEILGKRNILLSRFGDAFEKPAKTVR